MDDKDAKPFNEIKAGDTVYCIDLAEVKLLTLKVESVELGYDIAEVITIKFDDSLKNIFESEIYYDLSKTVFVRERNIYSTSKQAILEFFSNVAKLLYD